MKLVRGKSHKHHTIKWINFTSEMWITHLNKYEYVYVYQLDSEKKKHFSIQKSV